ncbi:MAG TPA: hypothetical protein VFT22_10255 [Kofleriaceae bacterium]|nr:hypothetical protein [Kofleriaceae bacterium]
MAVITELEVLAAELEVLALVEVGELEVLTAPRHEVKLTRSAPTSSAGGWWRRTAAHDPRSAVNVQTSGRRSCRCSALVCWRTLANSAMARVMVATAS